MRLQIGQNIDNNRVRLDFRKSPDRPANSPTYEINKDKADEFVRKYNAQEKKLLSMTMLSGGILAGISTFLSISKHSWKMALFGIPGSIITGLGIGTLYSAQKKNDLMDEYDVKEFVKK